MAMNGRSVSTHLQNAPGSKLRIYCNGRFNYARVGQGTWAFVVMDVEGKVRVQRCGFCENRVSVTHIDAEYEAVIAGLRWAIANAEGRSVELCTSLELIEKQVYGNWRVKAAKLLPLRDEIRDSLVRANATVRWIPIHENELAHHLSLGTNCVKREGVAA